MKEYTIVIFTNRVSEALMNYLDFIKTEDGWEYRTDNIAEVDARVTIAYELRYECLIEIRPIGRTWTAEIERGIDNYEDWCEYYGEN